MRRNPDRFPRTYQKMRIFFYETATTMIIDLESMQVENWLYRRAISISCKVRDECHLEFMQADGHIDGYQGYVPDFFPSEHFGDYIIFPITADGKIEGWQPTDKQIYESLLMSR